MTSDCSASPRISEGQGNICPEWGTFCAEASGKGTSASIGSIKVTGEGGLGAGPRIRNKKFLSLFFKPFIYPGENTRRQ